MLHRQSVGSIRLAGRQGQPPKAGSARSGRWAQPSPFQCNIAALELPAEQPSETSTSGRPIDQSSGVAEVQQSSLQLPAVHEAEADDKVERKRLWWAAIKPPMYSVGFIPVLVAGAAVYAQQGQVAGLRCAGFALAAILVIAWLNLSNDAFDAMTGVDKAKRESVVNLTGNRTLVLTLANVFLVAGIGLLATLISKTADPRPACLLAFSIACGYVYQGPPFRLSYKGLGEPLCFFAFGPSATSAFYLALLPAAIASTATLTPLVGLAAMVVGITTTMILFCSHFHQIEGDTAAGKQSPLVRLGTERALRVLNVATALPYLAIAAATVLQASGLAPALGIPYTLLPALVLSIPAAQSLLSFAGANHHVPALIAPLKIYAIKLHMAFGMSLVLGLLASRWFPM